MYFSIKGQQILARSLAQHLLALERTPRKVFVTDLDDTLWGGILGEDGFDGIKIGGENIGYSHLRYQQALKRLKDTGVILAICSKNNIDDVVHVLDHHPDMFLRRKDFAAIRANWEPKSENIKSMAKELSLGVDSFVFFDDSAFEREQMQQLLPKVDVIDVPKDPALYCQAISQYQGFDILKITDEDRARADMYATESQRKSLEEKYSNFDDFCRSLEMCAHIEPLNASNFDRIYQLIHKTNQFNLTTQRLSHEELLSRMNDEKHSVYALRLKDKLGESGLTGIVLMEKVGKVWKMENMLLSCRIIGRTVEYGFLRWLSEKALSLGMTEISASFFETPKNTVARSFLADAGFKSRGSHEWSIDLKVFSELIPKSYVSFSEKYDG